MSIKGFPYIMTEVEPKFNDQLKTYFKGDKSGFLQVGPKKFCLPYKYKDLCAEIYNLPLKPTDVFVVSYARSGTTWTQELVWLIANDLDYAKANATPLTKRCPFLEHSMMVHPDVYNELIEINKYDEGSMKTLKDLVASAIDIVVAMPSPRFIKTHMPISLLPPNLVDLAKVVYVARDPRDVAVSFFHLVSDMKNHEYIGDFKRFWGYFIKGLYCWAPYFEHVKEAWDKRDHPNMLFLFYEDLCKDLPAVVGRVSQFFNKQCTEDEVQRLCEHLSIENFRKNKSVNFDGLKALGLLIQGRDFIRKGKSGGWQEYFDEEMTQQAEQWIADNLMNTDLRFPK